MQSHLDKSWFVLFLSKLLKKCVKGVGNGKVEISKELTPHSRTYELHGQGGGGEVNTKSRQTNTSHYPTKTISKTDTVPLKYNCYPDLKFLYKK